MRLKTIRAAVQKVREFDSKTAFNTGILSRLIDNGQIAFEQHGNRKIVDYDEMIRRLWEIFGFDSHLVPPHVRTIDGALAEVKITVPELGVGEDRLRELIKTGVVPSLRIGNRCYILLELFHPPYDRLLAKDCCNRAERSGVHYRHKSYADEQIDELLSKQATVARVRRI